MLNKLSNLALAALLITSPKVRANDQEQAPGLIEQVKLAYQDLNYWVKQGAIEVEKKSWTTYQYCPRVSPCHNCLAELPHVHPSSYLVPVLHSSYQHHFANQAAQDSFENYQELSTQLANQQLLNNIFTGSLWGVAGSLCQRKLANLPVPITLTALITLITGTTMLEYDALGDLPHYDLLNLENYPPTGKAATIFHNTFTKIAFAAAVFMLAQNLSLTN